MSASLLFFDFMNISSYFAAGALLLTALPASSGVVARFSMDVEAGKISETISGQKFDVKGNFSPENVPGAVGEALRFDGYTSRIEARLGSILPAGSTAMTVSLWVAVPCYPIIQLDTDTSQKTTIVSCLDEDAKSGFGFFLGFNGKYSFRTYVAGWPVEVEISEPLSPYAWHNLVAVVDCGERFVKVYDNGREVGSGKAAGTIAFSGGDFFMGQGRESRMAGPFELMSFNGLIDDVCIWNEALSAEEISKWKSENDVDLNIPESRFASQRLRPRFHGMPAAGWTNECHGMYHSDGRYHLFFQKNADGPYMARLHWGHISSSNLYDWREEKIALAPGDWYDIKGCWSGCVFADAELTGNRPNIIYTAVDYVKAMIAQAAPQADNLENWIKSASNPIIGGKPSGLSDDFRDPYFFRSESGAYIIVGTSKNGVGATTLHRYDPASATWSNNGDIFFAGENASRDGRFWEMPNITKMADGRWIFTATPLQTQQGVRTLFWVGSINSEGKFVPDASSAAPRLVELNSREGFGLLSPTIYQHDGRTLVLGIVPDKLPAAENWKLGWAHCYSLPREWSLDADGSLVQRPYSGLTGMRSQTFSFSRADFSLSDVESLEPVRGTEVEILGRFVVGDSRFGFNIFKGAAGQATVSYNPATGELTADFSQLPRLVNDAGVYNGVYTCALPERPKAGSELKIDLFIDHSILDIFVDDRWATSIRVFPTADDSDGIEAFADSSVKVNELSAWTLKGESFGAAPQIAAGSLFTPGAVEVCDLSGKKLRTNTDRENALVGLPSGIYIVDGEKTLVR